MASTSESVVERETRIRGTIRGREALTVRGRVDGRIELEAPCTLEAGGVVRGDVRATEVTIGGIVVGDVDAVDRAVLLATAQVQGVVRTRSLRVDAGARIDGALEAGDVQSLTAGEALPRVVRPAPAPAVVASEPEAPDETEPEEAARRRVVVVKKRP